jgi:hypothetical protein
MRGDDEEDLVCSWGKSWDIFCTSLAVTSSPFSSEPGDVANRQVAPVDAHSQIFRRCPP